MLGRASLNAFPRRLARFQPSPIDVRLVNRCSCSCQSNLSSRRYYGRIIWTIVSKHVSSISELVRPILPPPISSYPEPVPIPLDRGRTDQFSATTNSAAVALEDDAATECPEEPIAETDIQDHVRKLMRRVPHPVAIITSTDPKSPETTAFRGMTVSSFNTVTLYPEPVVSFNVKIPSETYNAIISSTRFLVHLLAPNDRTARLAREFSKGHENLTPDARDPFFRFTSPSEEPQQQQAGGSLTTIRNGEPPRLTIQSDHEPPNGNGANFPFIFECKYLPQSCRVGDHVVVLGTVVRVLCDKELVEYDDGRSHESDELCLTYADTRFWKMGGSIPPRSKS